MKVKTSREILSTAPYSNAFLKLILSNVKKPDAIFFDWDGTLIDGFGVIFSSYNAALEHFGLPPMTQDEARANVRLSAREIFPKIFGDNAEEAQKLYYSYVREHHLRHIKKIAGADELLEFLSENKIPMGVVSNKKHEILAKEIEHFGWSEYFGTYLGAGIAARDKPAPDPLIQAAANMKFSVPVNELWYIGDTETDMEAAKAAMFTAVFIGHGLGQNDVINQFSPALSVENCDALISHLRVLL